jgi:rhamnulokinase
LRKGSKTKTERHYLAFDIGASSGRGVVGSVHDGCLKIQEVHRFTHQPISLRGTLRWDVLQIWANIMDTLKKCCALEICELQSIGVDTWNLDFGLLNARGELIMDPVSYRQPIRPEVLELISASIDEPSLYRITGIGYMSITGLARLIEFKEYLPKHSLEMADCYLPLADLLRYFLTGQKNIEETIMWGTQLADVTTRILSPQLLKVFGLSSSLFPSIVRSGTSIGTTSSEVEYCTGIRSTPVIAVAGHDTASALVPVGDFEQTGRVILCTGTWFILGMIRERPLLDFSCCQRGFLNEIAADGLTYLAHNMMGFYLLEGLVSRWKLTDPEISYEALMKEAAESPEFFAFININDPDFFSSSNVFRSLHDYLRNTRQPFPEGRGILVRILLEGLSLSCRVALRSLMELTNKRVDCLYLVGGGAKNVLLCQMIANATGCSIIAGPSESTVIGNIELQMISCSEASCIQDVHEIVRQGFSFVTYNPEGADRWAEAEMKLSKQTVADTP